MEQANAGTASAIAIEDFDELDNRHILASSVFAQTSIASDGGIRMMIIKMQDCL